MKQIKLAFAGQMRSGKDTCSDYIVSKYGGVKKSFAAPIYDILAYAQKRSRLPQEKDRQFLQYVGTEWARAKDQDIWVNLLIKEVNELDPSVAVAVSDARFLNEFETLKANGFIVIKLDRSEEQRTQAEGGVISQAAATHASELDMLTYKGFDAVIHNWGPLSDLYPSLDQIVQTYFSEPVSASVS